MAAALAGLKESAKTLISRFQRRTECQKPPLYWPGCRAAGARHLRTATCGNYSLWIPLWISSAHFWRL